jgi:hypothetical protein
MTNPHQPTDLGLKLLQAIHDDDYQNGQTGPATIGCPVWMWSVTDQFGPAAGGIIQRLLEQGHIGTYTAGRRDDWTIWLSESGYQALQDATEQQAPTTHVVQGIEHPEVFCLDCNEFYGDPAAARPLRSENGQALVCCNCGRDDSGNLRPGYAGKSVWVETCDPARQEYEGRIPASQADWEALLDLTSDLTTYSISATDAAMTENLDTYRAKVSDCMSVLAEIQTALEVLR